MRGKLLMFLSLPLLITQYQNCSKINVSDLASQEKATAMNTEILGGEETQDDPIVPADGDLGLPTLSHCSYKKTIAAKTSNVMLATSLELQLNLKTDKTSAASTVCKETDLAKIRGGLENHQMIFPKCAPEDGNYEIKLLDQNGSNLVVEGGLIPLKSGKLTSKRGIRVLMDTNPNFENGKGLELYKDTDCDETASPLFVDLRRDQSDMDILSSPEKGVYFDILGANAFPAAHTKFKISWFERGRFAMLALPDQNGNVSGIDQLFGNNTLGPDGQFADNGFLALAKFDSNKDGLIDSKDTVFSKLRLWSDSNRNGKAEPGELKSLSSEKFIGIDLKYDANYYERDKYGNEIKYKSVAIKADGKAKPVFDVWFAIKK